MDDKNQTPAPMAPQPGTPLNPLGTQPGPAPLTPQQPMMGMQPPARKSKKGLVIGVIVAVLLLLAGIGYGVYAYMTGTPEYLLGQATEKLTKQEAFAAKFNFTSGTGADEVKFNGDFAARADGKNGEVVIGLGAGNSRVAITGLSVDSTAYVKASSLSNLSNLLESFGSADELGTYDTPEMKAALKRIDGQWFSITASDAAGLTDSDAAKATGASPDDLKKVGEIYRKHAILTIDKSMADEKIDDVNTAHFTVKASKEQFKAFMQEVKAANLKTLPVTDQDITDAQEFADDFNKNATLDVWVARDSKAFKQIRFANTAKDSEGSLTLTMLTELPKLEDIKKPTNVKPFSQFLTTFLGTDYYPNSFGY